MEQQQLSVDHPSDMNRKLIIDGNAVYEIDEACMLKKQLEERNIALHLLFQIVCGGFQNFILQLRQKRQRLHRLIFDLRLAAQNPQPVSG